MVVINSPDFSLTEVIFKSGLRNHAVNNVAGLYVANSTIVELTAVAWAVVFEKYVGLIVIKLCRSADGVQSLQEGFSFIYEACFFAEPVVPQGFDVQLTAFPLFQGFRNR